jgi:uncharacterized protein
MRLNLDFNKTSNIIQAYREGCITINGQDIHQSLIVAPDRLIADWVPQNFLQLQEDHFQIIEQLQPEIVLLGTGARQQFPHPRLTSRLLQRRIGVEVMGTAAACRTYNIIVAEGRQVVAALLII